MQIKVVFRVDAASYMGIGHVIRCLTLASALKEKGADILFVCREHPGHLGKRIISEGHRLHLLSPGTQTVQFESDPTNTPPYESWLGESWVTDLSQTQAVLKGEQFEWLIIDHYALDSRWERGMRKLADKILVIDDLADRMHDCDFLLDQSFGRKEDAYKPWVGQQCKILTGSKYALLRPEFSALRDYSLKRRADNKLEHLLITMGGTDQPNATGQVLEAIQKSSLPQNCRITVVMGDESPWLQAVREQAKKLTWSADVKVNVSNMAHLMANCDLAIGAAGGTSWERCCLGLPTLMLVIADNQSYISDELEKTQAVIIISKNRRLSKHLLEESLLKCCNKEQLDRMSESASRVCNGQGVKLIVKALSNE